MNPNMLGAKDALSIEYDGQPVLFMGNGWFNATGPARRYSKEPSEWRRLPETIRYLEGLKRRYGNIPYVRATRVRADRGGGTWMHPKLAIRFAQWLDVDFAIWCDEQIDHILRGGLGLLSKESFQRSETPDRERLLTTAAAIVARHRLPFGTVYEALNLFAGVACARDMSCAQVSNTAAFGERLLSGTATPADFARIDQHRATSHGPAPQLVLTDGGRT